MSITSEVTWSRADIPWREDHLQMAVATYLRRANVTFAADQNEGRRSPRDGARRKAMGMAAGEPDLRIYLPNGRTLFAAAPAAATSAADAAAAQAAAAARAIDAAAAACRAAARADESARHETLARHENLLRPLLMAALEGKQ